MLHGEESQDQRGCSTTGAPNYFFIYRNPSCFHACKARTRKFEEVTLVFIACLSDTDFIPFTIEKSTIQTNKRVRASILALHDCRSHAFENDGVLSAPARVIHDYNERPPHS